MAGFEGAVEKPLGPWHAESLVALSAEAGWNQVAADWRFMLEHGKGLGMMDDAGAWVATALTLPLGPQLSWISMVLTTKPWRGRGIGTHLLRRCIDMARAGDRVVGLDATELGRPIYEPLGFEDTYELARWRLDAQPEKPAPLEHLRIRPFFAGDLDAVAAYDAEKTGMQRRAMLAHLHGRAPHLAFVAEWSGDFAGYVLGRDGRLAFHVGPIVADVVEIGMNLAARAMAAAAPPFIIDAPAMEEPAQHSELTAWLAKSRATRERGFTRMTLGWNPDLAFPADLYAIAGPELA